MCCASGPVLEVLQSMDPGLGWSKICSELWRCFLSQQDQHTRSGFANRFPQAEQEQKSKIVHIPVHEIACPNYRHVTPKTTMT